MVLLLQTLTHSFQIPETKSHYIATQFFFAKTFISLQSSQELLFVCCFVLILVNMEVLQLGTKRKVMECEGGLEKRWNKCLCVCLCVLVCMHYLFEAFLKEGQAVVHEVEPCSQTSL